MDIFVVIEREHFGAGVKLSRNTANLLISSLRFVTHLSLRSSLMFVRAELIGLWADDTGNSQILSARFQCPATLNHTPKP